MPTTLVLHGTVTADGKLELEGNPVLPTGHVKVTVETMDEPEARPGVLEVLEQIRAAQKASGHKPRTREQIDADIKQMRDEWDEHDQALDRLQEECQKQRQQSRDERAA